MLTSQIIGGIFIHAAGVMNIPYVVHGTKKIKEEMARQKG